jgi:hypothetical protein
MRPAAGRAAGVDHRRDRFVLRLGGPGRQPGRETSAVADAAGDAVGMLGVDQQEAVEPGDGGHDVGQLVSSQRGELRHARVRQERLEAEHAGVVQRLEVSEVARHRPAPEADVGVALTLGGRALDVQRGDGRRRRDRVERHVHQGGDPAGRGRAGGGREPLPLGPTGLVAVHVRVDQAGDQHAVHDLGVGGRLVRGCHGHDAAVVGVHRGATHALRRDGLLRDQHKSHGADNRAAVTACQRQRLKR